MGRKPNRMYRYVTQHSFCRKEYAGGIPPSRITQFNHGNTNGKFDVVMTLRIKEKGQLRSQALEAARISSNRYLQKKCGSMGYHLRVRVMPHHILRENKVATGAGADRVSQGMRRAYGTSIGIAARVIPDQKILTVRINKMHVDIAKDAMRRASMKLASPCYVEVEKGQEFMT